MEQSISSHTQGSRGYTATLGFVGYSLWETSHVDLPVESWIDECTSLNSQHPLLNQQLSPPTVGQPLPLHLN
jgi:hypothetical protein